MTNKWNDVIQTTVTQYPLQAYKAVSVIYNAEEGQELIVAGYASPQVIDRQKHLITKEALARDLPRFLAHPHYRNAMLLHSNVQVGEVLPKWCHPLTGECWETKVDDVGLFSVIKVRTDPNRPSIVDKVIADIQAGKIASFSISADAPFESRRYECVDGACFWIIDAIEFYEITLCEQPVNQDANFTILSKSTQDEFKASAFCQDGSCPIITTIETMHDDNGMYLLRKAELSKAPLGGAPGFRGNGVADAVKPIPAAQPKPAIDPRQPQRADVGAKAGGDAGAHKKPIADTGANHAGKRHVDRAVLDDDEDKPYEDELEEGFDNAFDAGGDDEAIPKYAESSDSEEYYLNKSGFYVFDSLESLLEKALDSNTLDFSAETTARIVLSSLQQNRHTILKGFSWIHKATGDSWVAWADNATSTLNKEFIDVTVLLSTISNTNNCFNLAQILKKEFAQRRPLQGMAAANEYNDFLIRLVGLNKSLDQIGLTVNGEAIRPYVEKGFQIGWIGNAQRALHNAVEALQAHVINHAATRDALSPDVLAALDVLYEDMRALEDNMGIGMALDKYQVEGDHPELEIINAVAQDTLANVEQADLLLERVENTLATEMADPAQQVQPTNHNVVVAKGMGMQSDIWEAKPRQGEDDRVFPARETMDTLSQGSHNTVNVNRNLHSENDNAKELVKGYMDDPVHVVPNGPVEEAAIPGVTSQVVDHKLAEFDQRGALKAGDEDAKATGLMFDRLFRRALNDPRYKLAIVKNDGTETRYLDLGE